jgi:predicted AlkP superfamily pyrophosphatase or phosphodiesterase
MRRIYWPALLGALAGILAFAFGVPLFDALAPRLFDRASAFPGRPEVPRVLLVSVDGLSPRFMGPEATPVLERLAREGLRARTARTVVPSITMTSHTSMITGTLPAVHRVLWNTYQPGRTIDTPTLFDTCAAEGLRCGLMAGKRKFAHFAEGEPGVSRWVYGENADAVIAAALAYVRKGAPDFVMVHLAEVDLSGHRDGWGSEAQRRTITEIDAKIGGLVEAAAAAGPRPLRVLVTSDHGGHGDTHGTASDDDVLIPWILWGDGITPGVIDDDVSTLDTAATIAHLLDADWTAGGTNRAP